MELEPEYQDGQTPLEEDEKEGLLINSITTHGELDEHLMTLRNKSTRTSTRSTGRISSSS